MYIKSDHFDIHLGIWTKKCLLFFVWVQYLFVLKTALVNLIACSTSLPVFLPIEPLGGMHGPFARRFPICLSSWFVNEKRNGPYMHSHLRQKGLGKKGDKLYRFTPNFSFINGLKNILWWYANIWLVRSGYSCKTKSAKCSECNLWFQACSHK